MSKTYLKINLETLQFTDDDDDEIAQTSKIYPADWLLDESYHTLLTYEIMENLKELRELYKRKNRR